MPPPDAVVAEPPVKTTDVTPPPKAGDKFRAAMKAEGVKNDPPIETKTDIPPAEKKSETPPPAGEKKPSALDTALAGDAATKPDAVAAVVEADPLKEFDDKPNWVRAREVMKTQSEDKKTLNAEVERLKGELGKVDPKLGETLQLTAKERDELKEKNAKLLEAITQINVKLSPDYQEKYVKGRSKLIDKAVGRVKEYGGDVDKFNDALGLTGKNRTQALKEALSEVDDLDKPRIIGLLDQVQSLDDEAAELDRDPQKAFEELESKRAQAHAAAVSETEKVKKAEFDKVIDDLKKASPFLRSVDPSSEGGAEWNDTIQAAFVKAERAFGKDVQFNELVELSVKGARYDSVEKMLIDTRTELREANKRLREYDEASPDFRGHKKPADRGDSRTPGEKYHAALDAEKSGGDEGV